MTDLQISNSLTRSKDLFKPINPKKIGMYVCGPTVYANPHVGNGRSLVVFDLLFRVLLQQCHFHTAVEVRIRNPQA